MKKPGRNSDVAWGNSAARSGNDFFSAQARQYSKKHVLAVESLAKTVLPDLYQVRDEVVLAGEARIGRRVITVRPAGRAVERKRFQTMLRRHVIPERPLVAQELRHQIRLRSRRREPEKPGKRGPHVFPAEVVTIVDVERLIAALGRSRNPDRRPRKQAGVTHVEQRLEAALR